MSQVPNDRRDQPYPELSWTGVAVGYCLGALITVSVGFASLKLGFAITGSELAAILGFGVLRGVLRRTSIIENNINQTVASAVNAASAGITFSIPALFILQYQDSINIPLVLVACIAGAFMGIAFVVPLRKQMIDYERLPFPGGIAVATILKSPGAGIRKAQLLAVGALVSGGVHLWSKYQHVDQVPIGSWLGIPDYMNAVWGLSIMTIGVGFLSGRGGISFILGGFISYWILAPLLHAGGYLPALESAKLVKYLRVDVFMPVGIGMLIGGALTGVVLALPLVLSSFRSMRQAARTQSHGSRDELSLHVLLLVLAAGFTVFIAATHFSVPGMNLPRALLMGILAMVWLWMSGVILSECTGKTNWSPLSGMTLIGITGLIFVASGLDTRETIIAAVTLGAATCVGMAMSTDLMTDLKTGYLVGAVPRRQQIAQMLGCWLGPFIILTLLFILNRDGEIGTETYPAPQGTALAKMIQAILNLGGAENVVTVNKYLAGAGIGAVLSASGMGGLGVLVGLGFYLPFDIVLTYTIGTILRLVADSRLGPRFAEDTGIPIAAGFIIGEALVGVFFALFMILKAQGVFG